MSCLSTFKLIKLKNHKPVTNKSKVLFYNKTLGHSYQGGVDVILHHLQSAVDVGVPVGMTGRWLPQVKKY